MAEKARGIKTTVEIEEGLYQKLEKETNKTHIPKRHLIQDALREFFERKDGGE